MDANQVFETVVSHTKEILPDVEGHLFLKSDRLLDLGANSVDRAEIIMLTLETLAMKIPMHELVKNATLGELAKAIATY